MSTLAIPRPASDEAAPFYHGCIAEVRGENIGSVRQATLARNPSPRRSIRALRAGPPEGS
jgi:hypothetical protein